jgi:pimeloyl-ACP methyl ester carboxylesterase
MKAPVKSLFALLFTFLFVMSGFAQDAPASEGVDVMIEAGDGRRLYGTYFSRSDDSAPAVLLLHQLYTNRSSWTPLIYPLLDNGFKVLAVDLRGYGQTRGAINWDEAQNDSLLWGDWLRGQTGVSGVRTVGSSMGANLALNACAVISDCGGAVAISGSLNYFDVTTADALAAGFPVLLMYAARDPYPRADSPRMIELGGDHIESIVYDGRAHGVSLFDAYPDAIPSIVAWLLER